MLQEKYIKKQWLWQETLEEKGRCKKNWKVSKKLFPNKSLPCRDDMAKKDVSDNEPSTWP